MGIARWVIGFAGVLGTGGLLADYLVPATARQHLKNPAWPPHAKFHNAQTILLGIGLGALTVVLVAMPTGSLRLHLIEASCTASLYWLSMLFAPIFPGTAWIDPEFEESTLSPLSLHPQQALAICVLALVMIALGIGLYIEYV